MWQFYVSHFEALPIYSTVATPFYIPTSTVRGLQFLYILANTCYFFPSKKKKKKCYDRPHGCEVVMGGGFNLRFPDGQRHEHSPAVLTFLLSLGPVPRSS